MNIFKDYLGFNRDEIKAGMPVHIDGINTLTEDGEEINYTGDYIIRSVNPLELKLINADRTIVLHPEDFKPEIWSGKPNAVLCALIRSE